MVSRPWTWSPRQQTDRTVKLCRALTLADSYSKMNERPIMSSVLIVDDESAIRAVLARWLGAAGYDVREAVDAESALDELAKAAADVVLCDVKMPGQGGLWLAGQLRDRFPATAIVLATASDSVPPTTSLKPGIIEYLVKPFARDLTLSAVARGVTWHAAVVARGPAPPANESGLNKWLGQE
jgi:CheY-like chemotaxis protein